VYLERSNPWGDLDQMSLVGRYGGRNHVCNIWWLSVKGCGCGERGKFSFSHWLDASPLQHWSHYRVTVWFMYLVTQLLLIILQRFLMYHCDCLKNKFHENTAMFEAHLIRANTWTLGIMDCLVCRKVEIFSKHLTFSRVFS